MPKKRLLGIRITKMHVFGFKKGTYVFETRKRMILGRSRQNCVRINLYNPNLDEIWAPVKYPGEIVDTLRVFARPNP
jgi:flagellar assembly factor FliW